MAETHGLSPTTTVGTHHHLINSVEAIVDESIDGFVACYPHLRRLAGHRVVFRADIDVARLTEVSLVSGGGSSFRREKYAIRFLLYHTDRPLSLCYLSTPHSYFGMQEVAMSPRMQDMSEMAC